MVRHALRAWALAVCLPHCTALCSPARPPLASLAGKPAIVDEIIHQTKAGVPLLHLLPQVFPFELDGFQLDTLRALVDGRSVVVSAPTGSGKTVCGEIGIYLALARGHRVVYTTPLKALSNQKFSDLRRQFGRESVGLLTGDTTINRDAAVLVMTTEVYRNMLLKRPPEQQQDAVTSSTNATIGDGEAAEDGGSIADSEDPLLGVRFVVLDEFHYMNDPTRGTVWEECCILSPSSVRATAPKRVTPCGA